MLLLHIEITRDHKRSLEIARDHWRMQEVTAREMDCSIVTRELHNKLLVW